MIFLSSFIFVLYAAPATDTYDQIADVKRMQLVMDEKKHLFYINQSQGRKTEEKTLAISLAMSNNNTINAEKQIFLISLSAINTERQRRAIQSIHTYWHRARDTNRSGHVQAK